MKQQSYFGKHIALVPLSDSHYEALQTIVLNHADIYRYTTIGDSVASFARWFTLAQQQSAWTVMRLSDEKPIGSTRLYAFDPVVGAVKVGYTWYSPDCRGTGINDEAKLLLLTHVFETLEINRVVFEINANNQTSCRAVEKLGAVLEGRLREARRGSDGELADSCVYALFADNWQSLKKRLQQKTGTV